MSLPPINNRGRASVSLPSVPSNYSFINYRDPIVQDSVIRLKKIMRPEVKATMIYRKESSSNIDRSNLALSRLSLINPSIFMEDNIKKTTYLKKQYLESLKSENISKLSFSKERESSFKNRSFEIAENAECSVVVIPNIPPSIKPILTIPRSFKPYRLPKKNEIKNAEGVNGKLQPIVNKPYISNSRYINESLQTEINSFDLSRWELDPYA